MDNAELRDKVMEHDKSLGAFDEWAQNIERRVLALEASKGVLVDVQIALEKQSVSLQYFGEKLIDMKDALEKINEENKAQHQALSERIKKIEDAPGDKWNKAVWVLITAALMAASAGITKIFAP